MSGGLVADPGGSVATDGGSPTTTDTGETATPGPDETGDRGNPVDSLLTGTGWTRQDVVVAGTVVNVVLFALLVYMEVRD